MLYMIKSLLDARFYSGISTLRKNKILSLDKIATSYNDSKERSLFIKEGDIQVYVEYDNPGVPNEWIDLKGKNDKGNYIIDSYYQNYIIYNLLYPNIKNHNDSILNSSGTMLLYARTSDLKTELDDKISHAEQIESGIKYAQLKNYRIIMLFHNGKSGGFIPIKNKENKVIDHDFTLGYNVSRIDFMTFIGGLYKPYHPSLPSISDEEKKILADTFNKDNIKALYCLRVDRLTRSSNMMRYLWENLVLEKNIQLIFGVKREWNLDSSEPHPFLDSDLHRLEIFIEAAKAEDFERIKMFQGAKAAKTKKRNREIDEVNPEQSTDVNNLEETFKDTHVSNSPKKKKAKQRSHSAPASNRVSDEELTSQYAITDHFFRITRAIGSALNV